MKKGSLFIKHRVHSVIRSLLNKHAIGLLTCLDDRIRQKSGPRKFFAVFSATVCNFNL